MKLVFRKYMEFENALGNENKLAELRRRVEQYLETVFKADNDDADSASEKDNASAKSEEEAEEGSNASSEESGDDEEAGESGDMEDDSDDQ